MLKKTRIQVQLASGPCDLEVCENDTVMCTTSKERDYDDNNKPIVVTTHVVKIDYTELTCADENESLRVYNQVRDVILELTKKANVLEDEDEVSEKEMQKKQKKFMSHMDNLPNLMEKLEAYMDAQTTAMLAIARAAEKFAS